MREYAHDALTYCRKFGRPDLFVTMTCGKNWPEIQSQLRLDEKPEDRYDIITRVFAMEVKKFTGIFRNGKLFGEHQAWLYVIEWQKRGLPHCHFLIWLKHKLRRNQIDDVISAEIPDRNTDPQLYSIVTKHMIHDICGPVNPNAPCMKDGRCSKKYPYAFQEQTCASEDGYPWYRRRSPSNGGHSFIIEQDLFHGAVIDNSRVVPHSPVLLRLFNCHINTEYCHSVKAMQYSVNMSTRAAA